MQTRDRVFDDAARMAGGALGVLAGVRREVETFAKGQIERLIADMDLVPREEFEAAREMAARARDRQEALEERIAQLEARIARLEGATGVAAEPPAAMPPPAYDPSPDASAGFVPPPPTGY